MNISSLIVHAQPRHIAELQAQWRDPHSWPGVEVHAATPDGRLVLTIEADSDGAASALFDRIRALPGVMSAALVFHQFEPDSDADCMKETGHG